MAVGTDTMSITELAERLGVSPSTAYDLAKTNELPFRTIRFGDRVMVSRRAYESWIAEFDYEGAQHGTQNRPPV